MRFSKKIFTILTVLTSFASLSSAQMIYESPSSSSAYDWNGQGCSVYGGCAAYGGCASVQYTGGCSCQQSCRPGFSNLWYRDRAYFEYEPILPCPGDRMNAIMDLQKLNGRTAQMVFHSFHFEWNSHQQNWMLSRSGWIHVHELARILPGTPGPIRISPSGDSITDQLRVQLVHEAFAKTGVSHLPQLVLQAPVVRGLYGDEAVKIYETRQLGTPFSQGAGSADGISSQAGATGTTSGR